MAKQKANITYHSIRMNLNNEQHRRVHKVLTELNMDVHKSVNQFLIDATDDYINRLNGVEIKRKERTVQEKNEVISDSDFEKLKKELREELLKEIVILLGSAFAGNKEIQRLNIIEEKKNDDIKQEEDTLADETTIGLAASWG